MIRTYPNIPAQLQWLDIIFGDAAIEADYVLEEKE